MKTVVVAQQYRLDGSLFDIKRLKFDLPFSQLRELVVNRKKVRCDNCWDVQRIPERMLSREVWERPFDDEPVVKHFCDENCEDLYLYGGGFAYFYCDDCNREVCEQNPSNGWHRQLRLVWPNCPQPHRSWSLSGSTIKELGGVMKPIRVATIANGDPSRETETPRIRLALHRVDNPSSALDKYKWVNETYPEEDLCQPRIGSVREAMEILHGWYNWPGWELVTRHTDNRNWK